MNVKTAEKKLFAAVDKYMIDGDADGVKVAAVDYGKAKMRARRSRDNWKIKRGRVHTIGA